MTDEEENVSSRTQPKPLIISPNPRKRTKLDRTFNDNEEVNGRRKRQHNTEKFEAS